MRSNVLTIVWLALTALPLAAQSGGVTLKVDLVAWGNDIHGLSFKPGAAGETMTAHSFRYSTPAAYSGPAVMAIYQTDGGGPKKQGPEPTAEDLEHEMKPLIVEEADAPGDPKQGKRGLALELEKRREKEPTLVALAVLPANCRRAMVLLGPAGGGTYTAYVIDDDPGKLPLGQVRIHNLSPVPVMLRCNGKDSRELATRATMLATPKNDHLVYELAYKSGDEWKMQENNVIPVPPKEQTQMVILRSNNSYFLSADGSSGGFLQIVTLRRQR